MKKVSISCEGIKTLKQYLKKILEVARRGDAREESYYSTLETLLNEFAKSTNKKDIYVTSQPKKTDAVQSLQLTRFLLWSCYPFNSPPIMQVFAVLKAKLRFKSEQL